MAEHQHGDRVTLSDGRSCRFIRGTASGERAFVIDPHYWNPGPHCQSWAAMAHLVPMSSLR